MTSLPNQPMRGIRGAIIICDAVEMTVSGKFIIIGTHNLRRGHPGQAILRFPLVLYMRLQFDVAGTYAGEILLIDREKPSNEKPLLRYSDLKFIVSDPLSPVETPCIFPDVEVECPVDLKTIAPNQIYALPLLVWLKVDGADIASSPLTLLFCPPKGGPNEPSGANSGEVRR
jgi:hypothetical protein